MYKLMIVDDELYIREVLKRIIPWEEYGFSISATAENGEQALEYVEKEHPDLIIADIEMPFINGIELAETLSKTNPEIKIILLTGHDDLTYVQRAIKQGVYDCLLKPTIASELISAASSVRTILDRERMERDLRHH